MLDFTVFGLSNRDKRVYDALLRSELSSIRNLAELTGINRGSVYESIKALQKSGLVTYVIQGKSMRYNAEDPEKLHEIITERRRDLLHAHTAVDDYLKGLNLERHDPGVFGFASFYEGDEGMANILRDILTTCRVAHISSYKVISSPRVSEYLYINFRHFTRERIRNRLRVNVLRQTKAPQQDAELSEWKLLPGSVADTGSYSVIYGTKLAIISINGFNHTSGIIINNAGVTRTQELLFDAIWEQR